jgi:hypothetical protein
MKITPILAAVALAHFTAGQLSAQAPASVGDSFISFAYTTGANNPGGTGLVYLAADGTCRQVSASFYEFEGETPITPTYLGSATGTYTYIVNPGDPTAASLIITLTSPSSSGYALSLIFAGKTSGSSAYAPEGANGPLAFFPGTFTLLLHSQNTFLANVSNRVTLRPSDTAISGFVVQGSGSRLVLVRTVGPTLAEFGVSPVSQNPQLSLFSGTGTSQIGSGAPWDSGTYATGGYDSQAMSWIFASVGAFSLQAGSKDVAYFAVLSPGVYTAQSSDSTAPATGGSALTEVYILPYSG